ncbi:phage portal protein [Halostella sp. PRR32]|uniref:anti-CBASS protein Acb1 family protein n=1 Tax=Halostella sp. PRR32 TaxID=3098147 RepID=UPI002B1E4022|nr:anti-CBASS Acb1 family protein [Halostella sp. PRR32]
MTDENTTETAGSFGGMSAEQAVMMAATASNMVGRQQFANRSGLQHGGERDLWEALGYQQRFTYADYRDWYDRGGIAKPIIEKPAATTWSERPEIVDDAEVGDEEQTSFEGDLEALFDASDKTTLDRGLSHYFERADKLGRIGEYSVLYLGFADADKPSDLSDPVDPSELDGLKDLLYVTPLGQGDASINSWVKDVTASRNGLPKTYKLDLANGDQTNTQVVHHTRVIHIAEGVLDDDVNGEPALRPIMNRLFDIEKVAGASAEAYWMVSNPGLALSVDPEFADVDTDQMDEQIDEWENNFRRVLKMYGTDVEQLESQDVDPSGVIDSIMKLIAGTIEIPKRKLEGSERGDLASSQDEANYLEMISARQESFAGPVLLRPFIDRLVEYGIIESPQGGSYSLEWPNLFQLTELEEATLKKELSQALVNLAPMGDIEQLHTLEALREFSPIEEPEEVTPPEDVDDVDDEIDEDDEQVQDQFNEQMGRQPAEGDD